MKQSRWLAGGLVSWGICTQALSAGANSVGGGEVGRWGDGEIGRWGDGEVVLNSPDHRLVASSPHPPTSTPTLSPPDFSSPPGGNLDSTDPMAQVSSVSELTDVKPTDWAYQALQSLVERYGVLVGFPDATFRGNRTLTRYEFAAALNQLLAQVDILIANGVGSQIDRADVTTLRRLQKEYGSALTDLRDRLGQIGDRVTRLEAHQFSATTKLSGQVIFAVTDGSTANPTVVSRERLNLLTSFTPNDLLVTQLEYGNAGADAIAKVHNRRQNLLGTTGLIADGGGLDYAEEPLSLRLRRLYYTVHPRTDLAVTVGARIRPRDFIDSSPYASNEAVDFSSSFFIHNPLIIQNQVDRDGGAGAVIAWNIGGGPLTFKSLYVATDANQPTSTPQNRRGLFGDRYQGSAELEYLPNQQVGVRIQYTNALINNTGIEAAGINGDYAFNRTTAVFGRFGFGSYQGFNTALASSLNLHPKTWAVGLALRNLVIPGTLAGVAIGQPFVTSRLGNATQTNFEAFYNLNLSDNISITPSLDLVTNANNNRSNGTTVEGTLRTSFEF